MGLDKMALTSKGKSDLSRATTVHFIKCLPYIWDPSGQVIKCVVHIARVNTKRDWPICDHVALDKCNVYRRQQVKNCCPPRLAAVRT